MNLDFAPTINAFRPVFLTSGWHSKTKPNRRRQEQNKSENHEDKEQNVPDLFKWKYVKCFGAMGFQR